LKVKLLNVLTVCLVTLAVLSPGVVVFSVVWGRHTELVKTQNLACVVNKNNSDNARLSTQTTSINPSPNQPNTKFSDCNVVNQILTATEQYRLATLLQWLILLTPICIGLGILVYDRYLVYRAAVLKEQIAMLERLWQQSIEQ
jgi:hypothetical protein